MFCQNQLTPLRGHDMGWSFRRSKSFGPFRLNFSKSGIGFSFGGPGARVGVNAKGKKYFRGGIPGTGLYYQSTLPDEAGQAPQSTFSVSPLIVLIAVVVIGLIIFGIPSSSPHSTLAPVTATPQTVAPVAAPVTPKPVVRKHRRKRSAHQVHAAPTKRKEPPAPEAKMPESNALGDTPSR